MCSALFNMFEGNVNLLWSRVANYYKFRPFRWKKFQQKYSNLINKNGVDERLSVETLLNVVDLF